jgi:hypothetical protein
MKWCYLQVNGDHHIKECKPGSKGQKSQVPSYVETRTKRLMYM